MIGFDGIDNDTTLSSLKTNLISLYEFDETSGTIVIDSIGDNDGSSSTVGINQVGKSGACYDFNGVNSKVYIDNSLSLNYGTSDITFACWLNTTSYTYMAIASHLYNISGFIIKILTTGYIRTVIGSNITTTGARSYRDNNTILRNLGWVHIAMVWKNSTGMINYYTNGILDSNSSTPDITGAGTSINPAATFAIGYDDKYNAKFFNGLIDQVGLWNKTLTVEEIRLIYNSGIGLPFTNW